MFQINDIIENVHYRWHAEDVKHGLYILYMNDDVEKWMKENIKGEWDIEQNETRAHHRYGPQGPPPTMIFNNEEDAIAFKLRWI